MDTPNKIIVGISHGGPSHGNYLAFVEAKFSLDAFYGGLSYDKVAEVFEFAASTMRANAKSNPGKMLKTLEEIAYEITNK